ncbi:MAG: cytochrome c3 family protein, partial [Desulfuromonadaceae bacterium]|nr:cytochrome c3 family protein [Desulfuromonadaceae bacterium]
MKHRIMFYLTILVVLVTSPLWAASFDHDEHVAILGGNDCSSCHVEQSESIVPAKDVCMGCHDAAMIEAVTFSSLKTHGVTWALSHRSEAKSKSINCSSCHQQSDCLECHVSGFADEMGSF